MSICARESVTMMPMEYKLIREGSEGMGYIRILKNGQDKWIEYHL